MGSTREPLPRWIFLHRLWQQRPALDFRTGPNHWSVFSLMSIGRTGFLLINNLIRPYWTNHTENIWDTMWTSFWTKLGGVPLTQLNMTQINYFSPRSILNELSWQNWLLPPKWILHHEKKFIKIFSSIIKSELILRIKLINITSLYFSLNLFEWFVPTMDNFAEHCDRRSFSCVSVWATSLSRNDSGSHLSSPRHVARRLGEQVAAIMWIW